MSAPRKYGSRISLRNRLQTMRVQPWYGERTSSESSLLIRTACPEAHEAKILAHQKRVQDAMNILKALGCHADWWYPEGRPVKFIGYEYPTGDVLNFYLAMLTPYTQKQLPANAGVIVKMDWRLCPRCQKVELAKFRRVCDNCVARKKVKPRRWCQDCGEIEIFKYRQRFCKTCAQKHKDKYTAKWLRKSRKNTKARQAYRKKQKLLRNATLVSGQGVDVS